MDRRVETSEGLNVHHWVKLVTKKISSHRDSWGKQQFGGQDKSLQVVRAGLNQSLGSNTTHLHHDSRGKLAAVDFPATTFPCVFLGIATAVGCAYQRMSLLLQIGHSLIVQKMLSGVVI